jgi:YbbR domain-containing protein
LRRKLRDDIGTALLAIVLAVIVWVNAIYQEDSPQERFVEGDVPIVMLNRPANLVATNDPGASVRVKVRAFSSTWENLSPEDFSATADWDGLQPGMHSVPVEVTCSDPTVSILAVHPPNQSIYLESVKRENREVMLEVRGMDSVPLGYRVDAPEIEPRLVVVEGPASAVDRVDHLALNVSVVNQTASIERTMEPTPVDEAGLTVQGVRILPNTVAVKIGIEKKQNYREVAVRVRTTGQPARGYFVSGVNVVPSTVTLVGPPSVMDTMGGIVDVDGQIDITGATRMIADKFTLDLPPGVSVSDAREGEVYEVLATVGIDPVTGGTTVELPIRTRKLQEGLAARLSVSFVDVILTGPAVLLDELQTDLLEAYVDLTGLAEGTHQIRPQIEFLVPADSKLRDIIVKDISPKSVEVTIALPPTPSPTPTLSVLELQGIEGTPTLTVTVTLTGTVTPSPTLVGTATVTPTASAGPAERPREATGTPQASR